MKMAQLLLTTILCAFVAFLKFCAGADTLFPNQTISVGQTLISSNQVFEMGFFSPGKSPNRFLGIWYKSTPEVVVWVANRNNPITDPQGVTFAVSDNGNLAISRSGSIIWSGNSASGVASNPVLQLMDTGNLVLVNKTTEGMSQSYIWQSFDYPTDTVLPGMKLVFHIDNGKEMCLASWRSADDPSPGDFVLKLENHGLPEGVVYKGNKKRFRTGKWNGVFFSGDLRFPNRILSLDTVFNKEKLISIALPYDYSSIIVRATLDISGSIHTSTMNARKRTWNAALPRPRDACDEYGQCGPNGICRIDKPVRCECLKGFVPRSQKDWEVQDWSGGCTRITALNCTSGGDGFLEVRSVKYPDMLTFWLNTSMSLGECLAKCSKNCSCVAYANPYITNGGSGCVMWFGDLIDIREHSGADSKQNIYIRLPVSELVDYSNTEFEKEKKKMKKKKRPTLILITIATGVFVSGFINGGLFMMSRRKRREKSYEDIELPLFKFATIVAATNNFSWENLIGQGGFGPVYKGQLSSEEEIALKRLSRSSGQGLEEFKNEVILIAKLQHTNLVRLLGCCIEGEERVLIYEYLHNRSLDYFVFDQNQKTLLTWPKRFEIIMGSAKGLLYLHHDSRLKIIHRDLKTSNILLDKNLTPKISDFGLARIFEEDQPIAKTRRVVGTYGYMAPEYAIEGKFSVKSDIFSMGVVLLEIVSGKKNRGLKCSHDHCHSLLGHAWLLWKENKILELMDECLNDTFVESEVKRCIHVGLLCVQSFAEDRPVMSSVLFMLGTEGAILPEPKQPGFFTGSSIPEESALPSPMSEGNTITITDLEAR